MKTGKHYHETRVARLLKQARQHERASILRDLGTRADVTRLREVAAFLDGYQAAFVASAGRTHEALVWRDMETRLLDAMGRELMNTVQLLGRKPDFIIGGEDAPYLRRWFVRPEGASGGLYLHEILRDDDDRALHDHPWDSSVYIIRGAYREVRKDRPHGEVFGAGSYRHMPAEQAHRLVVVDGPVWTLCFLGPRKREWGFHCPNGWIPWQQFVSGRDKGLIGAGCGDT